MTLCQFTSSIYIKSFSASLTWLLITYLVWVSGVCLSFLFTTSNFESELCFQFETKLYHQLSLVFVLLSASMSVVSLFVLKCMFNDLAVDAERNPEDRPYEYHKIKRAHNANITGIEEMEQV